MGGFFSSTFSRFGWNPANGDFDLGLDGAGKTIILYRLQVGLVVTTIPTIGFYVGIVIYKNLESQAWDQGGQTNIRPCCGIILQTQRHPFL
uniref:Uncharacterized protein n=1 Tax=Neovison vison TaxID=452646 RepID=A0A8C7BVE0_NEOVI